MLNVFKVLGLACSILVSQLANGFEYALEFSQADIQKQIDTMLPIKKETFLAVVTLDQANVIFVESSDQLILDAKIFLSSIAGVNSQGSIIVQGGIFYNSAEGAFYFHQAKITKLDIEGIPPEFMPVLKDLAQQGLTQSLAQNPIYILKKDDIRQQLVKLQLKSVLIKDQKLIATMGI
ncbi:MAG: hypothetical protein ACJA0E_002070 [Bermanella sp.]|jgi:hypothetical protein